MLGLHGDFLNRIQQLRKAEGWPETPWQQEVVQRASSRDVRGCVTAASAKGIGGHFSVDDGRMP